MIVSDVLVGLSYYELGRARGAAYGRAEPNACDLEWIADRLADEDAEVYTEDFEIGMLDGAEQVAISWLKGSTAPPSAEVIAAATDRKPS